MTKAELISLLQVQLSGGTPATKLDNKFHDRVIELQLATVINDLISEIRDSDLLQQYCARYDAIPVLENSRGKKYFELPASFITTQYMRGIWVYPAGGDVPMSYRKNNSAATYANLEAAAIWTKAAYSIIGQNGYLEVAPEAISEVDLVMLVPFNELGENDNLVMPGGKDGAVFKAVLEQMRELKVTPEKYRDDGNTNTK